MVVWLADIRAWQTPPPASQGRSMESVSTHGSSSSCDSYTAHHMPAWTLTKTCPDSSSTKYTTHRCSCKASHTPLCLHRGRETVRGVLNQTPACAGHTGTYAGTQQQTLPCSKPHHNSTAARMRAPTGIYTQLPVMDNFVRVCEPSTPAQDHDSSEDQQVCNPDEASHKENAR